VLALQAAVLKDFGMKWCSATSMLSCNKILPAITVKSHKHDDNEFQTLSSSAPSVVKTACSKKSKLQ
jgi:hypothetical protein